MAFVKPTTWDFRQHEDPEQPCGGIEYQCRAFREGTTGDALAQNQDRRRPMTDQYPVDAKRYRRGKQPTMPGEHMFQADTGELIGQQAVSDPDPVIPEGQFCCVAGTKYGAGECRPFDRNAQRGQLGAQSLRLRPPGGRQVALPGPIPNLKAAVTRLSARIGMPEEKDQAATAQPHKQRLPIRRFGPNGHPRLGKRRGR